MRCSRCAKSQMFSTIGSHRSQGPQFCTLQPLLVHQGFFPFSLMLATGPRGLNTLPIFITRLSRKVRRMRLSALGLYGWSVLDI